MHFKMECLDAKESVHAQSDHCPKDTLTATTTPSHWPRGLLKQTASATCQVDTSTAIGLNYNSPACCLEADTDSNKGKSIFFILFKFLVDLFHRRKNSHEEAVGERAVSKEVLECVHERQRHRAEGDSAQKHNGQSSQQQGISMKDILLFCKGHTAVLDSIKFKGELMRQFEQETKTSWFDHPPEREFRAEAEHLLDDFAENLLDIKEMLQSMRSAISPGDGTEQRVCGYAGIAVE